MRNLDKLTFHPTTEKIVDLLCERTQNTNPQFFRMMVYYYICKMAATMRVAVRTQDRGDIPVNFYGINLGSSGIGKGHSTNILEDHIINKFRTTFFEDTLPSISQRSLRELGTKRAKIHNLNTKSNPNLPLIETDAMIEDVKTEFESLGKMAFSFDSGTTAAVKQMRHKLLMANIGAMNLEIDEIGSNLLGNVEVLNTFLELFDVGKVKQKLTKNTKENIRSEEIEGKTPTNLMLFGTPAKLFDGAKTESEFWSFIQTGYGRRCFFGYTKNTGRNKKLTAEDIYNRLTSKTSESFITSLSNKFAALSAEVNFGKKILVSKQVSLAMIEYKMHCEDLADNLGEHEEMKKAELSHRYFKAMKLAGGLAFMDGHGEVTEDNFYHAVAMAEESGRAFDNMVTQDDKYVKLAKYIAGTNHELTHVDLAENLAFYKVSQSQKLDLMNMAIAWGYKNSVIIKRKFENNIEFITGETLTKTDINELYLSHSDDLAVGYKNVMAPFKQLPDLMKMKDHHWCSHHSANGRRSEENMVEGFNVVVLDIDGGVKLNTVKVLLQDYSYVIHTTKRHTDQDHRFRVVIPMNYILKLNETDYKDFMNNVYEWLPFDSDTDTGQRSRKWATTDGTQIHTNVGQMLDALLFIPRTSKNDDRCQAREQYQDMTGVERWFLSNSSTGNRNNQLLRYGMMLVDSGYNLGDVDAKLDALNQKLDKPLSKEEINQTITKSVHSKFYKSGRA